MNYLKETVYVDIGPPPGTPVGTVEEYINVSESETAKMLYPRLNRNRSPGNYLSIQECMEYARNIRKEVLSKYLTEDEALTEMATVATDQKLQLRLQVNPDRSRIGVPYFKVFNSTALKTGETKVARLRFKDSGMEYHNDKYLDWVIDSKDLKIIIPFLKTKHDDFPKYTNWEMAKWLWNMEYGFIQPSRENRDSYFAGKYDEANAEHASYVSSEQEMPETWIKDF